MNEPIWRARRMARSFSGERTASTSIPSVTGKTIWLTRVRTTDGTPRGSSRSGGHPMTSSSASDWASGSGWMIATRRM